MRPLTRTSTPSLRTTKLPRVAFGLGLAVAATLGWMAGCSSSSGDDANPCASKYKGECGLTCTTDANCAAGVYCGPEGKCTVDPGCVTSGAVCGDNLSCTGRGRCTAGGLFGNDLGSGLGDAGACVVDRRRGEGLPADIYIMNDQSLSMTCAVPTGGDRWTGMKTALTGFLNSPNAAGVGVGIQYFGQGNGVNDPNPGSSCDVALYTQPAVEIAPLPGNAAPIIASLNRQPTTYTPTPAAIDGALAHAKTWAMAHPDHIVSVVLATDGQPNKCGNPNDRIGSVVASAATAFNGTPQLRTYVIGIIGGAATGGRGGGCSQDPAPPNKPDLDRVAKAGGTDQAFIVDAATGDTSAQFLDALNRIRGAAVIPCQYILPPSQPGREIDPQKVNVTFAPGGGTPKGLLQAPDPGSCDPTAGGWYYDDPNAPKKILLCPKTCDAVKADAKAAVDVLIGCKTLTIGAR
jgi:hypothetical protein